MPRTECIHYVKSTEICKEKNKPAAKTTCTKKCYKYDSNPNHVCYHKEIIWLDKQFKKKGYIGGIEFFTIEEDAPKLYVTTTIPSFVPQVFDTITDCYTFASKAASIYIQRIANV